MSADHKDPESAARPPRAAERIFDTACDLFYRDGIRAVGVDEIVTRAGVTKPSLYRSFASKDDLAVAYLRQEEEHFWGLFDAACEAHPDDPRAQVLAYFEGLGERSQRPGYRGCGLTNAAVEYPRADHPARQVSAEHKQALRARLAGMARAMGAARPDALADGLLLLLEGVYVSSQLFGPGGPAGGVAAQAALLIDAYVDPVRVRD